MKLWRISGNSDAWAGPWGRYVVIYSLTRDEVMEPDVDRALMRARGEHWIGDPEYDMIATIPLDWAANSQSPDIVPLSQMAMTLYSNLKQSGTYCWKDGRPVERGG